MPKVENLTLLPHVPANWRPADDLYRQISSLADAGRPPTDHLAGLLARTLSRILASYDGCEDRFALDLFARWSDIDGLEGSEKSRFRALYCDKRFSNFPAYKLGERPRPKPFEAAVETCRRLITVNAIRDALAGLPTAGILGGSASYGRFFNTKGINDPSDIDLMVLLPSYSTHLEQCVDALRSVPGISDKHLEQLRGRIHTACELEQLHKTMSVSQKVYFWDDQPDPFLQPFDWHGTFLCQFHFFSASAFQHLILNDHGFIGGNKHAEPLSVEALDYRNDEGRRREKGVLFSFAGTRRDFTRALRKVDGGFLVDEVVCEVIDGRFYPGVFHNLILPRFEVRWDNMDFSVHLAAKAFVWKMYDRLTYERQLRVWEDQHLAHSHIRHNVFSPHELARIITIERWA
jgi:hypothetical protein